MTGRLSDWPENDPDLVQIHANHSEIRRRIEAFCSRKVADATEKNSLIFCGRRGDEDNSCARVDAICVPRQGRCRYKVTSVDNQEGPQTQTRSRDVDADNTEKGTKLEERVADMEQHCGLGELKRRDMTGHTPDMLARIKRLEDRIIYLEGISLEYFNRQPPKLEESGEINPADIRQENPEDLPIEKLDERIKYLQQKLLSRREGIS